MRLHHGRWTSSRGWTRYTTSEVEALLSAWREDYQEPLAEDPTPPGHLRDLSQAFLHQAEVWPPNSLVEGIQKRLDAMAEVGQPGPSLDEMIRNTRLLVVGRRAVRRFRTRNDPQECLNRSGYTYALALRAEDRHASWDQLVPALKHRFREVNRVGAYVVASEAITVAGAEYHELLRDLANLSEAELLRSWKRATALGVEKHLAMALPPEACGRIAACVVKFIKENPTDLSWRTDLRLWGFHEGHAEDPELLVEPVTLAAPLFDQIRDAQRLLANCHRPFEEDAFVSLAQGVAELPFISQPVSLVDGWPIGSSLLGFLDRISLRHPEVLARLVNHPCTTAVATPFLHLLPRERSCQSVGLELEDEWQEVQSLLRERLVLSRSSRADLGVALDLAESDESHEHRRLEHPESVGKPSFPLPRTMTYWGELIEKGGRDEGLCDLLLERMEASRTDPRFRVTARLMQLMEARRPDEADRLARILRTRYCSEDDSHVPDLSHAPDLLDSLSRILRKSGSDADAHLLCPPRLRQAPDEVRHRDGFGNHLHNLAAVSQVVDVADLPRIANAVHEVRDWGIASNRWDWSLLSGHYRAGPPALVKFGKALGRADDDFCRSFIDRLSLAQPGPLELGQIAQGLGPGHVTAPRLGNLLSVLMERWWDAGSDICLGHLQSLMAPLHAARLWAELTRCAEEMDQIAQRLGGPNGISYRQMALKARLQAQFTQDRESVLSLNTPSERWAEAIVRAFQGVAALLSGDADRAQREFRRSLEIDPTDEIVLCNLPACHMIREDWDEALNEIGRAREVLHRAPPGELSVSEAICHYRLGNPERAFDILRGLPPDLRCTPNAVLLRLSFMLDHAPDVATFRTDLAALRPSHPELATIIESRLAPMTHLELAAPWIPGSTPRRVEFEELCRLAGNHDPAEFLLRLLVNSASDLTRRPNLVGNIGEDATTDLLAWKMDGWLQRFRATARTRVSAGHGPSDDGEPDLVVETVAGGGPARVLMTAEAKPWDGPHRVEQAFRQLSGTSNTDQELVRAMLLYCRGPNFDSVAQRVNGALQRLGHSGESADLWPARRVEESALSVGSVRVFRSEHARPSGAGNADVLIVVHTVVLDLTTDAAREVRRRGGGARGTGQDASAASPGTHRSRRRS